MMTRTGARASRSPNAVTAISSVPETLRSPPTTPAPRLSRTLRVVEGPKAGQTIALEGRPLLMGRAQDADLVLVDDYASGRHARLFPQGTRWFLEDLGSTNGTTLNGRALSSALLEPDSIIDIGATRIVYRVLAQPKGRA